MKTLAMVILTTVLLIGIEAAASDPLIGLRFCDGKSRSFNDFAGQTVMVVTFCGHCPIAGAHLGKQIKALYDFIETEKVPVTLVLATPDFPASQVAMLDKERGYHMEHALWASDFDNPHHISLQNVYQDAIYGPNHQGVGGDPKEFFASPRAGTFRYPLAADPSDLRVKEIWWQVERQRPDAVRMLVAVAKTKSPAQAEVQLVLTSVKETLTKREADLVAATPSMAVYENLESLLTEAQGIELKLATAQYLKLSKDKSLAAELDARAAYRKCQELITSPRSDAQEAGKTGLAQIAKRYPETIYGRRAGGADDT